MHKVIVNAPSVESCNIQLAIEWLSDNKYNWDWQPPMSVFDKKYVFMFENDQEAAHFALRWS